MCGNLLNRRHLSSARRVLAERKPQPMTVTMAHLDTQIGIVSFTCISRCKCQDVLYSVPPARTQFHSYSRSPREFSRMPRWRRCALICMPALFGFGFVFGWVNVSRGQEEACSTHKCAQINVSYLSFYSGFDKRPGFTRASESKYSMYNEHTLELITCYIVYL